MKLLALTFAGITSLALLSGCATGTPRAQTEMSDTGPSTTYVDSNNGQMNKGTEAAARMINPIVQ